MAKKATKKPAARGRRKKAESEAAAAPVVALSPEMFRELMAGLTAIASSGGGGSAELQKAMGDLSRLAQASELTADEFKRQVRRSNANNMDDRDPFAFDSRCSLCLSGDVHPETHTRAHPKPKLKYTVYFCRGIQREDQLSPLEIELFNSFTQSVTARNEAWKAVFEQDGTRRKLFVDAPFEGYDQRIDLPPLTQILSELLYGQVVADPSMAMAMIADMKKQIEELQNQLASR